jgi:hypothetical protein
MDDADRQAPAGLLGDQVLVASLGISKTLADVALERGVPKHIPKRLKVDADRDYALAPQSLLLQFRSRLTARQWLPHLGAARTIVQLTAS